MEMRKLMLGLATLALASCSNEEVTDIASQRGIQFNAFVNHNTKALTEVTTANLSNFYVFAQHSNTREFEPSLNPVVNTLYNNELSTAVYYWEPNKTYVFAAYCDGAYGDNNQGMIDDQHVVFTSKDSTIKFIDYHVSTKDLVVATNNDISTNANNEVQNGTAEGKVGLTFKHMLSQARFTFNTVIDNKNYKIEIKDVKINKALTTATGFYKITGYNNVVLKWNGKEGEIPAGVYDFGAMAAMVNGTESASTDYQFMIPQDITDITFTATLYSAGKELKTTTFKAKTDFKTTFDAGHRYNIVTKVTPDMIIDPTIDPDDPNKKDIQIKFTIEVEDWVDGAAANLKVEENQAADENLPVL